MASLNDELFLNDTEFASSHELGLMDFRITLAEEGRFIKHTPSVIGEDGIDDLNQLSHTNKHIFSRKRNFYLAGIEPDKIQQIDSNPIFNEVKNIGIVMGLRYLNSFMSRLDYLFPQLIV